MDVRSIRIKQVVGDVAGDVTVTGIKTTDLLLSVQVADFALTDGAPNTREWAVDDLTSEFSITDADTINNDGGTSTADKLLTILYVSAHERGAAIRA